QGNIEHYITVIEELLFRYAERNKLQASIEEKQAIESISEVLAPITSYAQAVQENHYILRRFASGEIRNYRQDRNQSRNYPIGVTKREKNRFLRYFSENL